MIMPMPIYLPSGSGCGSGIEYIYPKWVMFLMGSGLTLAILGTVLLLISWVLEMITENDIFDPIKKPACYTLAMALGGVALCLIALPLMMLTGVPVTE